MVDHKLEIRQNLTGTHLTLECLGDLTEESLPHLQKALARAVKTGPEAVTLDVLGCEFVCEQAADFIEAIAKTLDTANRSFELYCMPNSLVRFRLESRVPISDPPPLLFQSATQRLLSQRQQWLEIYRQGLPQPEFPPPDVEPSNQEDQRDFQGHQSEDEDLVEINYAWVAARCNRDERVVRSVWENYCQFVKEERFTEVPQDSGQSQLEHDATTLARHLHSEPQVVVAIIATVSEYLSQTLGEDVDAESGGS